MSKTLQRKIPTDWTVFGTTATGAAAIAILIYYWFRINSSLDEKANVEYVLTSDATAPKIVEETGITQVTVYKKLHELSAAGLIVKNKEKKRWECPTDQFQDGCWKMIPLSLLSNIFDMIVDNRFSNEEYSVTHGLPIAIAIELNNMWDGYLYRVKLNKENNIRRPAKFPVFCNTEILSTLGMAPNSMRNSKLVNLILEVLKEEGFLDFEWCNPEGNGRRFKQYKRLLDFNAKA